MRYKKILLGLLLVIAVGLVLFQRIGPRSIDAGRNQVISPREQPVSEDARRLHQDLIVVDLHADSLLWARDPAERHAWGHVDLPRLADGNVALQGFTIVTKSPWGRNIQHNTDSTDSITALSVLQAWPARTWMSLTERALFQAQRLRALAKAAPDKLVLIRSRAELARYLERREREPRLVAGFLGVEGAHALDGSLANIDVLFDAGVRMMAPTHFFDNDLGGSAHGAKKGGLTEKGRAMLHKMEAKGMLVDLAHASARTIKDVLALATRPVVVSHTGVRGTCDNQRNLSDPQLRAIAKVGGVIGIGFWQTAVCGDSAAAIARAIRHAVTVTSIDHVALGSDFDGSEPVPFDASGLSQLTAALLDEGFSAEEVRKIMGQNTLRLLAQVLP